MTKTTLLQILIPVAVPIVIATLKHFLPRLPKPWLPVLAPLLGAMIEILGTQQLGVGTAYGAALGAAGVGLREILDQVRKALEGCGSGEEPGAKASASPPGSPLLPVLLASLCPLLASGCHTADETAFKTIASLEAAVDHAMAGWGDYVVLKRAETPPDDGLAGQEQKVKAAYASYRAAINAAYAARAAYLLDHQAGLPTWQARLDAARAAANELIGLVDMFLTCKSPPTTTAP